MLLKGLAEGYRWLLELYTADDSRGPEAPVPSGRFELTGRSMAVFREAPCRREAGGQATGP